MADPTPSKVQQEEKKNKHNLTPLEEQQEKLNRLFQKIDKPVYIPEKPKDKNSLIAPPKDFVRNVSGSSAGAGSGDFHVYRAQRRREFTRRKILEEQEKKNKEDKEYQEKLKRLREEAEERTAKKRAKRQKRNKKKQQNQSPKEDRGDNTGSINADKKQQQQSTSTAAREASPSSQGEIKVDSGEIAIDMNEIDNEPSTTTSTPTTAGGSKIITSNLRIEEEDTGF